MLKFYLRYYLYLRWYTPRAGNLPLSHTRTVSFTTPPPLPTCPRSLSCLTDVFNSLAQKQAYIPFRNSKLTYLLQPALSGDGKTMMFVNLSPTDESYFESLCSLRFASNVNQVELGKAVKNVSEMSAKELEKRKKGEIDDKSPPRPTMNKRGNTPPPPSSKGGKGKSPPKAGAGRGVGKSKTMR